MQAFVSAIAASIATTIATVTYITSPQCSGETYKNLWTTHKLKTTYIHWARIMKIHCIFLHKNVIKIHFYLLPILKYTWNKRNGGRVFCSRSQKVDSQLISKQATEKYRLKITYTTHNLRGIIVKQLHFALLTNIAIKHFHVRPGCKYRKLSQEHSLKRHQRSVTLLINTLSSW